MEKEQLTLERRIRAIEDRLEIYNLIAGHPPSADTGNTAYAEAVFTADAVFDRGPDLSGAVGNKAIGANLQSAGHQAAISGGLAHFTSLPHVTINGDTAVVVSYLQILTPRKSGETVEVPNHGGSRWLSHPSRGHQSLGPRPHARGLENQTPHFAAGRRLRAGASVAARRAAGGIMR